MPTSSRVTERRNMWIAKRLSRLPQPVPHSGRLSSAESQRPKGYLCRCRAAIESRTVSTPHLPIPETLIVEVPPRALCAP